LTVPYDDDNMPIVMIYMYHLKLLLSLQLPRHTIGYDETILILTCAYKLTSNQLRKVTNKTTTKA